MGHTCSSCIPCWGRGQGHTTITLKGGAGKCKGEKIGGPRKGRGVGEEEDTCTIPCTPSGTWLSWQRRLAAVHAQSQAISQPASGTRSALAAHLVAPTSPPAHTGAQTVTQQLTHTVHGSVCGYTPRALQHDTIIGHGCNEAHILTHPHTARTSLSASPKTLHKPHKKACCPAPLTYLASLRINNVICVLMHALI